MTVTKRTRYEVLKRDNHMCRYCHATDSPLTVDHVVPTALGGGDSPDNLVAACKDCNAGKSSTLPGGPLVADVAQKTLEWAAAIVRYNEMQMADRRKRDAYVRRFTKAWGVWHYGFEKTLIPKPSDWKATIWQFYSLGFPIAELEDAVTIACGNNMVATDRTFRYMCGVVWNKVEKMQQGAKDLLEAGDPDGA